MAAALIGGTFFSGNAGTLDEDYFGCIDVLVHYATTIYHDAESGEVSEVKHYRTETRCSSSSIAVEITTVPIK